MADDAKNDFVDEVMVAVAGGDGGNGCVAFRREKSMPFGGPAGGDGADGGSVIFEAQTRMRTLLDLRFKKKLEAQRGEDGRGKDQYGKRGKDLLYGVPVGTLIYDAQSQELLADLSEKDARFVAAAGGVGGRGNIHFATPYNRAPRQSEQGTPGQRRRLRLELKLMADVGLVGFPNVGKSTFISTVSRAKPKIAAYPFTTLVPNLGVVHRGEGREFVVADIPGIVEGAAEGVGLGLKFLRHVERTSLLLHIVSGDPDPERDPLRDYHVMEKELARYSDRFAGRPRVVALSKLDLPENRERFPVLRDQFAKIGVELLAFSSATREGVDALLNRLEAKLAAESRS